MHRTASKLTFRLAMVCGGLLLGALALSFSGCESTTNATSSDGAASNGDAQVVLTSRQPDAPQATNEPVLNITFDDLKFPHTPDEPYDSALLTEQVLGYVEKKIRVRGYILPTMQKDGIRQFVLVRDNQECCFGPGAALFDCVRVQMNGGQSVRYTTRPVSVEGRFTIDPVRDYADVTRAVFFMHADEVE
ncbi:MAG: DUF3299 domain-containing protein [Planctomycetota bacterium]|nr:MAG: DUF3299 domain-containing protein [Planctomycetota bacterium]REJ92715.1 MAG: DUF3299 domain-containing protein [Planctomycetota bacterium]